MNTIQLVEKIHKRQGLYVASLKKSEFFEMFPFDDGEERFLLAKDSTEKKLKQADYFKLIQSYIQRHVKSDFKGIKITYGFSNGKTCGRMYAQDPMAIQRLNRQLRAFLTQGLYHDYDMKSAHPTFVRHLCEGKAYCETTYQDKYLNDRTRLLKEGNTDKHTMLAKLNTDDARFYKTKSEDLWGLVKEWNLIKAHYFPLLMDDFPPNQASKNPMSSTMNQKLCAMENEILQVAIRNNEPAVLMFDGFMTEKDVDVSSLPSDVVVWEEKPIETEHVVPDDFDEGSASKTAMNARQAAQYAFEQYPHFIKDKDKNEFYMFNDEDGMYSTDRDLMIERLYHILNEHGFVEHKQYTEVLSFMRGLKPVQKPEFMKSHETSSLRKLLFTNGIYDEVAFKDGFDPCVIFETALRFPYDGKERESLAPYKNALMKRFFYDPLGKETGDYYAEINAIALMGDHMKRFVFIVGETNTGKSTFTKALKHSCGGFCASFNAETLMRNNAQQDEGQIMRPFFLNRVKRFMTSNEMSSAGRVDSNLLKKITSGGDELVGRVHGGNETEFVPQFKPFAFLNEVPDFSHITDPQCVERLIVIEFKKPYVKGPATETTLEAKSDQELDAEFRTIKFQKAFIYMLLDVYDAFKKRGCQLPMPESCQASKTAHVHTLNFTEEFFKVYEETSSKTDFVPFSELHYTFKDQFNITKQELGKMLKKVLRRDPERQYVITEYNDKKEQVRGYSQIRVKHEPVMALQDSS